MTRFEAWKDDEPKAWRVLFAPDENHAIGQLMSDTKMDFERTPDMTRVYLRYYQDGEERILYLRPRTK